MKASLIFLSSLFLAAVGAAQIPSAVGTQEKLQPGKIIERVVCIKNSEQSYALYLPSTYSAERTWPVVFAFDPGARGKIPVELMKDAAERFGYIVLAPNNSHNGAWKPEFEAADAMLQDAQARFNVDLKRIYFAGFSGGARVASQLAQLCKCAAGVLLSGAGFSQNSPPLRETSFPVFSAVGIVDFNYPELIALQEKLEQAGYPHWLRVFNGPHEWAPADVMEESLAWFRIQSMHEKREPRDEKFVAGEFAGAIAAAEKYRTNSDELAAWRQYKQVAATYEGLVDTAGARGKADELGKSKFVQTAIKSERSMFEEQERLSGEILGALHTGENSDTPRSETDAKILQQIRDLRVRADEEKKPERSVVLKRALAGIFVGAIETGGTALDKKEYRVAARYFVIAAEARPDAEWPLRQLAIAQALGKDRKAAIDSLKKARTKAHDATEFSSWEQAEPAFADIRIRKEAP